MKTTLKKRYKYMFQIHYLKGTYTFTWYNKCKIGLMRLSGRFTLKERFIAEKCKMVKKETGREI